MAPRLLSGPGSRLAGRLHEGAVDVDDYPCGCRASDQREATAVLLKAIIDGQRYIHGCYGQLGQVKVWKTS